MLHGRENTQNFSFKFGRRRKKLVTRVGVISWECFPIVMTIGGQISPKVLSFCLFVACLCLRKASEFEYFQSRVTEFTANNS